jgi:hypothetical protein
MAFRIIIGNPGSDAGYTVIDETGIHHVGGWREEEFAEVAAAGSVLKSAVAFKAPGMAEETVKAVRPYLEKELRRHLGDDLPDGSTVFML